MIGLNLEDRQVGFHGKTSLDESPAVRREVTLAVARAKRGDREAVRFLYVRYADNVYGYVRSIVRDDREAEDVTQHVFMKLVTVIVKYEDRGIPFSGWLLRLARNAAFDHVRRRRLTLSEDVHAYDDSVDDGAHDRARDFHTALASLPEEQRDVVIMRHIIGLTPGEIAERMGRTESSIHGLHHRGRRSLQQELLRMGWAPSTGASGQSAVA